LQPGQSSTVRTITINASHGQRADIGHGVYALPTVNVPPVINSDPISEATAGTAYSYQIAATDPDGAVLSYVFLSAPSGMSVNATGLVNWTPTAQSAAQTSVVLRVYDSRGGYATQAFVIEVTGGNFAPVLSTLTGDISAREGFGIVIPVTAFDPEGHALSVWVDNLPSGAAYDAATGAIVWMPGYESAGIYENVTVYASDGLQIVCRSFRLIVLPANSTPTLAPIANFTLNEGEAMSMRLDGHDFEGEALFFYSNNLPVTASLNPHTGQFDWTPGYSHAGVYDVVFGVTDGSTRSERTVRFAVNNENGTPVFDPMGTWDIVEGQPLEIQLFAFDPDNPMFIPRSRDLDDVLRELEGTAPSITYTLSALPEGAVFDSETQTLRWLPNQMQSGDYSITVTATDDGNGRDVESASITIPIIVRNANRSPVIPEIVNQTVARGSSINLDVVVTDADNNPLTFQASGMPPFGTFALAPNGQPRFTFAPGAGHRGLYTITLSATDTGDGGGANAVITATRTFQVLVTTPNEPPEMDFIGNRVAVPGTALSFEIQAYDFEQGIITFDAPTNMPAGAVLTPSTSNGGATFTWTPGAADVGVPRTVTFTARDAAGQTVSRQVQINVRASNSWPILQPIGARTLTENQAFQLQLVAS